jgi:sulfonate transport system ATP-binding protein
MAAGIRRNVTGLAPLVEVSRLTRSFGSHVVLDGVDFQIHRGEIVALIGASGSGKSTILRILAGLDSDAGGEVFAPVNRAVVFQDHRLMPWKSVWSNVVLGVRGGNKALALKALDEVGLRDHAEVWPATLSGGEAQRVALARALVREPDLLLLDEPFGALDALTRLKAQNLFAALCARHHPAALLVTHDVEEALLLANRVLLLEAGRITQSVDVPDDFERSRTSTAFITLREELLRGLGVDIAGAPKASTGTAFAKESS